MILGLLGNGRANRMGHGRECSHVMGVFVREWWRLQKTRERLVDLSAENQHSKRQMAASPIRSSKEQYSEASGLIVGPLTQRDGAP